MPFLCVLCGEKGFVFVDYRHESSSVELSLSGIYERFLSLIFIMNIREQIYPARQALGCCVNSDSHTSKTLFSYRMP